jgi:uncharacterized protein YqgV (UPF0045/DUF77 family)
MAIPVDEVERLLKVQQSAFESCIRSFFESVSTRIDSVLSQVVEVKTSLASVKEQVNSLTTKDTRIEEELNALTDYVQDLDATADYLENQSRRNNIRIDGIPEVAGETWEVTELQLKNTLVKDLGFTNAEVDTIKVERSHRTGKNLPVHPSRAPGHSKTATASSIVAKLDSFKDREAILKRARERRPQGLFFNEDFSKKVIETRKRLQPELQRHREAGQ